MALASTAMGIIYADLSTPFVQPIDGAKQNEKRGALQWHRCDLFVRRWHLLGTGNARSSLRGGRGGASRYTLRRRRLHHCSYQHYRGRHARRARIFLYSRLLFTERAARSAAGTCSAVKNDTHNPQSLMGISRNSLPQKCTATRSAGASAQTAQTVTVPCVGPATLVHVGTRLHSCAQFSTDPRCVVDG